MSRTTVLSTLLIALLVLPAQAAYSMKVVASMPKGSAGEKLTAKYPTNTKMSPCDGAAFDAVGFTVTYEATNATSKKVDRDIYFIMSNPEGRMAPRFLVLKKQGIGSSLISAFRADVSQLSAVEDVYIPRAENLSSSGPFTDVIISNAISLQGAGAGIWTLTGIVADGTSPNFSFDDPSSWDAWDTATIMLRKPWAGNQKQICE
ncbi:hypothetical protein [Chitinimonas lacunae]|uniref:Uncharacterized protein n=1 Tax=Chitinimonas lacunae TaxID=1963018 RepID=A0ABV8MY53_9NEIS